MSFKLCSYKLLTVNSIVVFYDFFFIKWGGAGPGGVGILRFYLCRVWDWGICLVSSSGRVWEITKKFRTRMGKG